MGATIHVSRSEESFHELVPRDVGPRDRSSGLMVGTLHPEPSSDIHTYVLLGLLAQAHRQTENVQDSSCCRVHESQYGQLSETWLQNKKIGRAKNIDSVEESLPSVLKTSGSVLSVAFKGQFSR